MAESATVLFSLAVEDPLASNLLEGVLAVAEAHGVSLRWGTCNGGLLVLAFDGPISQAEIVGILESKARSKSSSATPFFRENSRTQSLYSQILARRSE